MLTTTGTQLRDIEFSLFELNAYEQQLRAYPQFAEIDGELIRAVLTRAEEFARTVLAPLNRSGDREGAHWDNGRTIVPPGFHEAYQQYVAEGWPALAFQDDIGGQGLPMSLSIAVWEFMQTANMGWCQCASLGESAAVTISHHGSDEQKKLFLPKLVSGEWAGTMNLTEAHCGSDLGLLRTRAEPQAGGSETQADGSYRINGSKIFITSGEHDLTDNIIHLVLARLPDAPPGVKGISLFIVPKFLVDADGSLGAHNGVSCGSIEYKMGIKANPTCVMNFDDATGYLIGPPHQGLRCMFTMINKSRLAVTLQAQGQMEGALQSSLAFANERIQGRAPGSKNTADAIVQHPDIQRMLLTQKVFVDGGRAMIHYTALEADAEMYASGERKARAQQLLAILTPIVKGCITEWSQEATNFAVQILGGHGYTGVGDVEQRVRDARITQIYEGTTGIQALDLLTRKVLGSHRASFDTLLDEIETQCAALRLPATDSLTSKLTPYADALTNAAKGWRTLTDRIAASAARSPNVAPAAAYDYLMLSGYVVLGYLWLRIAATAEQQLQSGDRDNALYQSKLIGARFFFRRILPRWQSHRDSIAVIEEDFA